jgi:hypothetical protein
MHCETNGVDGITCHTRSVRCLDEHNYPNCNGFEMQRTNAPAGIKSAVASSTMKHTKKTLALQTEKIRNLSTQQLGHIAGGYTTVIYCQPTMTNPGNGCFPHPTITQ